MSSVDSLLESVRAAYARISEVEAVAAAHPRDAVVLAGLDSLKAHARQLEQEWEEQARLRQIEVCRYRLISRSSNMYSAADFAKSLLEFQELFSQIFDSKLHGARRRAIIPGQVVAETRFDFGYSYPGSLGVVLTMQDDPDIFGSKFSDSVKTFQEIINIENELDVRDAAKELGDAVVKRVYDWSSVNYFSGFNVDVTWSGVGDQKSGELIERETMGRLVDLIGRTSDIESRTFEVTGTLVAIDVRRRRFRFVVPDGEDVAGHLSESFDITKQWAVNTTYRANILVEAITRYATQRTEQTFYLNDLKSELSR